MIDLHCHLLFDVDDGPHTLEESLEMCRLAVAGGIHIAVSTPHVRSRADARPELFAERAQALNAALRAEQIFMLVLTGAEVTAVAATELDDEILGELCLGDSRTLLIEPNRGDERLLEATLFNLQMRGFRPAIAHPERASLFQSKPRLLAGLSVRGILNIVTAGSFRGDFGGDARKLARWMLADGLVDAICSDAHNTGKRPPNLGKPKAAPKLKDVYELLTNTNPAAILAGRELER